MNMDERRSLALATAKAVYSAKVQGNELVVEDMPAGYVVAGYYDDVWSGSLGIHLAPLDDDGQREHIFAMAGTQFNDDVRDLLSNAALGKPQMVNRHFQEMVHEAVRVARQGKNVIWTGHSLGGANSQYGAEKTARHAPGGGKVYSFNWNPLGARKQIEMEFPSEDGSHQTKAHIENYVMDGDLIPNIAPQHGDTYVLPCPTSIGEPLIWNPVHGLRMHSLSTLQPALDEIGGFSASEKRQVRHSRLLSWLGDTHLVGWMVDGMLGIVKKLGIKEEKESPIQRELTTIKEMKKALLDAHGTHGNNPELPYLYPDGSIKARVGWYRFAELDNGRYGLLFSMRRAGFADSDSRVVVGTSSQPPDKMAFAAIEMHQEAMKHIIIDKSILFKSPRVSDEYVSGDLAYRLYNMESRGWHAKAYTAAYGGELHPEDGVVRPKSTSLFGTCQYDLGYQQNKQTTEQLVISNFRSNLVHMAVNGHSSFDDVLTVSESSALTSEIATLAASDGARTVAMFGDLLKQSKGELPLALAVAASGVDNGEKLIAALEEEGMSLGAAVSRLRGSMDYKFRIPFTADKGRDATVSLFLKAAEFDHGRTVHKSMSSDQVRDIFADPLEHAVGAVVRMSEGRKLVVEKMDGKTSVYEDGVWQATYDNAKTDGTTMVAGYEIDRKTAEVTHAPTFAAGMPPGGGALDSDQRAGRVVKKNGFELHYDQEGKLSMRVGPDGRAKVIRPDTPDQAVNSKMLTV